MKRKKSSANLCKDIRVLFIFITSTLDSSKEGWETPRGSRSAESLLVDTKVEVLACNVELLEDDPKGVQVFLRVRERRRQIRISNSFRTSWLRHSLRRDPQWLSSFPLRSRQACTVSLSSPPEPCRRGAPTFERVLNEKFISLLTINLLLRLHAENVVVASEIKDAQLRRNFFFLI